MGFLIISSNWPQKQGLILDQYVAFIFIKILSKCKCKNDLTNQSNICLPLDIFNDTIRQKLLIIVLNNFQKIVIELKKQNISIRFLLKNKKFILFQIFSNSLKEFYIRYDKNHTSSLESLTQEISVNKFLSSEAPMLLEIICIYLIFGASTSIGVIFPKVFSNISHTKVTAFTENLIIQTSNCIAFVFLKDFSGNLLTQKNINQTFIKSIRDLEKFKNLIIVKSYIDYIFFRPKAIYNGYYRLWILKEYGIDYINIYAYRLEEFNELKGLSLIITLTTELQDLLFPQFKLFLAWLGKIIIYIFTRFINKAILLITKSIHYNIKQQ